MELFFLSISNTLSENVPSEDERKAKVEPRFDATNMIPFSN